jgi:hypothetical protein
MLKKKYGGATHSGVDNEAVDSKTPKVATLVRSIQSDETKVFAGQFDILFGTVPSPSTLLGAEVDPVLPSLTFVSLRLFIDHLRYQTENNARFINCSSDGGSVD